MPLPCRNFKQGHSNLGQFLNVSFSLWVGSAVESEYLYVLAFSIQVTKTSSAFCSGQTVFQDLSAVT